jgi:hypothetical protein
LGKEQPSRHQSDLLPGLSCGNAFSRRPGLGRVKTLKGELTSSLLSKCSFVIAHLSALPKWLMASSLLARSFQLEKHG